MLKKLLLAATLLASGLISSLYAQNVGINTDNSNPDASAMLDVKSINKGILIPRMTTAQRTAIPAPATGLMVFDNTSNTFWYFNGTLWIQLLAGTDNDNQDLTLTGNTLSLTNDATPVDLSAYLDADNLGNHTATTALNMAGNNINAANNITATGTVTAANDFFGRINMEDTRATNAAPNTFDREVHFEFKQRAAVGVPGTGTYSGLMTLAPWSDNSGNLHHQLNFNDGGIYYRTGQPDAATWGTWTKLLLAGDVSAWNLLGNAGTTPGTNFIGTTDAQDFAFRTNNAERMRILSGGNVGIGTTTPAYRLDLANGTFGFGNANSRSETRNDAGLQGNAGAQSGFYETSAPVNYPPGATSWWHMIDVRHSNTTNNYALQIAGSFFDQNLYFRKTNNSATTAWSQILSANSGWTTLGNAGTNPATNFIGTSNAVDFVTRTNNAERMRVTSAGNVGIGTTTPAQRLSVSGGIQALDIYAAGGQNIIVGDDSYLSDMDVAHRMGLISTSNATLGELQLGNSATNPVLSGNPGFLNVSQEMRVQNDRNRFRRATTPQVFTDQFDGFPVGVHISNNESEEGGFWANGNYAMVYSPGDNDLVKFVDEDGWDNAGTAYDGTALRARIDGGGQYFQVSDANAKENITRISNGLTKVVALSGYTYDFKLLPGELEKEVTVLHGAGILAQEVENVLPEAVSNHDGHYMVNYAAFVPLFIEAFKEQQSIIEKQNDKINNYETELETVKAKQEALEKEMAEMKAILKNLQK